MSSAPVLIEDDFKPLKGSAQMGFPVNHVLIHVTQETAELLRHIYSDQGDLNQGDSDQAGVTDSIKTVAIRAIEPEYMQIIAAERLTRRELEILQLIVDGYRNPIIANKLYISEGTVKTHVRSIFKKLCARDRTQAAIRALRSGLID